jgi:hypothetical protein
VEQAVHDFEAVDPPHPTDIFDHMYKDMPWYPERKKKKCCGIWANPRGERAAFING